jgi:hypothetical protein
MQFVAPVPTHNGNLDGCKELGREEYGDPVVLVHIDTDKQGVVITLGNPLPADDEGDDPGPPEVVIERRPNGWCVLVTTDSYGNGGCAVYLADDHECYIAPDHTAIVYEPESSQHVDCLPEQSV